jgi:uncharacterized Zn finger protein
MDPKITFDRLMLRRMANGRSFERGEEYFADRRVRALAGHEGTVTAKVQGARAYRVKLWNEKGDFGYSCSCPVGADGGFCKHCVAVGLAWLERETRSPKGPGKTKKPSVTMEDVRSHLAGRDKDSLVKLLMEQAMDDDRLRQRLLLAAAKKDPKGINVSTYRRVIDDAVDAADFVDYYAAHDYAQGIEDAVDSVEELLKEGHAAEAIGLTEHALAAVERAMGLVDDSDGYMGGILERLQEIHHQACRKAKPDPEVLAKRLFEWELHLDWETFLGAAERYADVLGSKGLALYRQSAEAEWANVPFLGPGGDDDEKYRKRFRITHIMETLTQQSGDVEALVAVKKRDLSHAYDYLEIAETYQKAGNRDLALEWAERGVKAFPKNTDSRLREFLAGEYHRRKRHDEAMALVWAEFSESPGLDGYKTLKSHAERVGRWPDWREKALALIRKETAEEAAKARKYSRGWQGAGSSELVRIFLWEKDEEAAWREAQEGGCTDDLWMQLAAKREKEHPADALPIYQGRIAPTLDQKNNEAYRQAMTLLRKVLEIMSRLGRKADFKGYLETVRAAHKPKRNFMALLEREKWG